MGSESPVGDHFASHAVSTPAFGLTLAIGELSFRPRLPRSMPTEGTAHAPVSHPSAAPENPQFEWMRAVDHRVDQLARAARPSLDHAFCRRPDGGVCRIDTPRAAAPAWRQSDVSQAPPHNLPRSVPTPAFFRPVHRAHQKPSQCTSIFRLQAKGPRAKKKRPGAKGQGGSRVKALPESTQKVAAPDFDGRS
jgi:hypothetical protein